jgi:hypothetical protein
MNTITIELCAEDRARLDAILAALQQGPDCDKCVKGVVTYVDHMMGQGAAEEEKPAEATTEAPAEAPADEPAEADTIPAEEETPVEVKSEPAEAVDFDKVRAEVQSLVVRLSASGKKDQARKIVQAYASRVSAIPEDKLIEAKGKLTALEG